MFFQVIGPAKNASLTGDIFVPGTSSGAGSNKRKKRKVESGSDSNKSNSSKIPRVEESEICVIDDSD